MQHALGAGWSSPVARQAHNLKVAGSNPAPATNLIQHNILCQFWPPKKGQELRDFWHGPEDGGQRHKELSHSLLALFLSTCGLRLPGL